MKILALAILLTLTSVASADRPLLNGSYEWGRVKPPHDKELDLSEMLVKQLPDAVWAQFVMTFEESKITVTTRVLSKDKHGYRACEISVTGTIEWNKAGFKNATKLEAKSDNTEFAKLTSMSADSDTHSCRVALDVVEFGVEAGDSPKLKAADGGIITLRKIGTDVDWKKHVK